MPETTATETTATANEPAIRLVCQPWPMLVCDTCGQSTDAPRREHWIAGADLAPLREAHRCGEGVGW